MDHLLSDIRYALRGLRLRPGFSVAIILILGLGIGANSAMFQVVDRLLLRAPSYLAHPERTHAIYLAQQGRDREFAAQSIQFRRYLDLTDWTTSFAHTAAVFYPLAAVGVGDDAREMRIGAISASTFALFNARPVIGRFFTAAEDSVPTGADVAVLSNAFWLNHYGADRGVLGQQIQIGPKSLTIIGVAPDGFRATARQTPAVFVPITMYGYAMVGRQNNGEYYQKYNMSWMEMYAERKPGVSLQAATADLTNAFRRSYDAQTAIQPSHRPIALAKPHAIVGPLLEERGPNQGNTTKVASWVSGVAAIVLLIACANVANLLLAHALRRRREIAVRLALGVSRGRLLSQLLIESLMLATFGAALGLAIAQVGGAFLHSQFLSNTDPHGAITDARTLLFTAAVAIGVGVLTGIAPALYTLKSDVAGALKSGAREGSYHRSATRVALLVLQGALSVILLVGAGLFVRSVRNVQHLHLGYDVDPVMFVQLNMRGVKIDSLARGALRDALVERARQLPGVVSATRAATVPFYSEWDEDIFVQGLDTAQIHRLGSFTIQAGSPEYFRTTGTRLLRGRGFTATDVAGAPPVMVVSEAMAKALWPGQDALGRCVKVGADTAPCREVVGVAENTRAQRFRDDPGLMYYLSAAQAGDPFGGLFVRVTGDARSAVERVRRELQQLMPGVSYVAVSPLADRVGPARQSWELGAAMFSLFGGLALVLAVFGLYSVIAYSVAQRSHELGVRMALGARTANVLRLVLRDGVRVAIAGVAIGVTLAWWAAHWIAPLLFQESARDPLVFVGVAALLLAAAIVASLLPALRATKVDPASALRAD
jgi:putative ABC transport system permease protein